MTGGKGRRHQRTTLPGWLRLQDAFKDEQDGSLRFFHRFWKRPLSNGATLREVLMSPTLDVRTIKQALAELRDAVLLSTSSDRGRNQLFSTGVNGHSGPVRTISRWESGNDDGFLP